MKFKALQQASKLAYEKLELFRQAINQPEKTVELQDSYKEYIDTEQKQMTIDHQSPTGEYNYNDYSEKMDDLIFTYDKDFYPLDEDLPDPQIDPVIPGSRVRIDKVGISPVDLPIQVFRRDGEIQTLQSKASLYCSLDNPNAKGLNLSRLYLLMHDAIRDHLTLDGIKTVLSEMATKQGSQNAFCKLRFAYPWTQKALRSRAPLTPADMHLQRFQTLSNGEEISLRKLEGHIAYQCEIEGQYKMESVLKPSKKFIFDFNKKPEYMSVPKYKFYLTVRYVYSSTCPCSFELAHNAKEKRNAAANAHSQRSTMDVTVEFDPNNFIWIEEIVELCRQHIPTEVQIVVKRRDEQAFAELNGSNLLFSEDVVRIMAKALDGWFDAKRIFDYRLVVNHEESLHPWNAIAVLTKGIEGGLR